MNPNPCLCAFEAEESVWLAGGLRPDATGYSESTESYENTYLFWRVLTTMRFG
jgi:hypothetical protein